MPKNFTTGYNIMFAAGVCVFWSILVSASAVSLKDRQEANKQFDKQRNILFATGLVDPDGDVARAEMVKRYEEKVRPYVVELKSGKVLPDVDPATFDQRFAASDTSQSSAAPANPAKVSRVPNNGLIYHVVDGEKVETIVVPVQGMGLWSTMYGYLALDVDTTTIKGVAFYEHGETPGLGGEVSNPKWTAKWVGRKVFDDSFAPVFSIKKGGAGPLESDPHNVDMITGATLTSNGVTHTIRFWLGESGYGPYLKAFRGGVK